ncbi:MAG: alpha/beta hydrolase fold domain-containing protein [Pseudomonadota bacterium]
MFARLSSLLAKIPPLPIVPTERAAWTIAGFAPLAVLIAALAPGLWVIAPIAAAALIALIVIDAYLAGQDPKDPAISPLFADLSMVPPTLVQVANEEALLDDTLRLEGKIPEITIDRWDDVFHVWQLKAGLSPEADEAVARMAEFLGAYLP